jgi:hypothetical protein
LIGAVRATAKAGRLRLKRTGTTLYFLWAPQNAGENFEEVHRCEFGTGDINFVWVELNSNAGRRSGALDVRLLDLKVRSTTPAGAPLSVPEDGRAPRSKVWLLAGGGLFLAILLALVMALVVRRRPRGKERAGSPRPEKGDSPEAAAPSLAIRCAGCEKTLKVKRDLAGKRVRCPHCGRASLVRAASPEPG